MNHRAMAAMVAGILTQLAGIASAQPAPAMPWLQTVEPAGWEYLTATDDTVWFVRSAVQPASGLRRVWIRSENANPTNEGFFKSAGGTFFVSGSVSLQEVDCSEQKQRTLQITYYEKRNMSGETSSRTSEKPSWSYSAPGTVGESWARWACRAAPPNAGAPAQPRTHKPN
jgi:hypothetical protein